MSNIGFTGLGRLGLPVALSIANKGHDVMGYDINPNIEKYLIDKKIPYREEGTPELLQKCVIKLGNVDEVVNHSDIVFMPIQTPHHPMYEGVTRIPDDRVDFDYTYLIEGVKSIADSTNRLNKDIVLIIISTVLPTTIETHIKPLLNDHIKLCYNPFFIGMGSTRKDFENPEFVLLGCDDEETIKTVTEFYSTIHNKPVYKTSIRNAEMIKVLYNTFISTKISFITTVQQLCHYTGCDVDEISNALFLATDRIISPKYLNGGMPDGGGCHPRDNIALSWLARKYDLNFDWFGNIMEQREKFTEWLADLIIENKGDLDIVILGKSFKRGTNITTGSPSILLSNILNEKNIPHTIYDPYLDNACVYNKALYFIGTNHPEFEDIKFPQGSIVLDVWGMIKDQEGVIVKRIGRND